MLNLEKIVELQGTETKIIYENLKAQVQRIDALESRINIISNYLSMEKQQEEEPPKEENKNYPNLELLVIRSEKMSLLLGYAITTIRACIDEMDNNGLRYDIEINANYNVIQNGINELYYEQMKMIRGSFY